MTAVLSQCFNFNNAIVQWGWQHKPRACSVFRMPSVALSLCDEITVTKSFCDEITGNRLITGNLFHNPTPNILL